MASDVSLRNPGVTLYSLLAVFPVLKDNTLSTCMDTALRASTATGIPAKKVHWLAHITCYLGWSLSLQNSCKLMISTEDKLFILKHSFLQCVCNNHTQSSYQLMVHNECIKLL